MNQPINLSALDAFQGYDTHGRAGRPLLLPLNLVHEDPNQPRREFDDTKQAELAASVLEVGVRVPVSVRPHPRMDGHYMLNFGARRRRAAQSAGLESIPALVDEQLTDFDQVIENIQRANLSPMELALFVSAKMSENMKPAQIAQRLGISRPAVLKLMALIGAPAEVEAVYTSGRSTSPDTIYELRNLYHKFPDQTRTWLTEEREVSRRSVDQLRQHLEAAQEGEGKRKTTKRKPAPGDPNDIKRPIVAVKLADRHGMIVLSRRASLDDHVLVKWDDTAELAEIPARDLSLIRVDDARRYEPINRGLNTAEGSHAEV